jgi:hypothetical protein
MVREAPVKRQEPNMGKLKNAAIAVPLRRPEHLTYALTAYTVQRRQGAWFVTPAWSAFVGERPEWRGPFDTIEDACNIIASLSIAELRRRHGAHIVSYRLATADPLYGDRPVKKRRSNGKALAT